METPDGSVIIPISRVTCSFAVGGSEFESSKVEGDGDKNLPFSEGIGARASVHPMGFLVVGNND